MVGCSCPIPSANHSFTEKCMAKAFNEKDYNALIDQAIRDDTVPAYARTLIKILAEQQEILQKEHKVLKRVLGPRYERALRRGPYSFSRDF